NLPEGSSGSFTVKLAAQPTNDVLVSVARTSGGSNISVSSGANLTFTSANWNSPQTVILSSPADTDTVNSTATVTISSLGLVSQTVAVTAVDIDVQSLLLSASSLTFNEGNSGSFTVKLA